MFFFFFYQSELYHASIKQIKPLQTFLALDFGLLSWPKHYKQIGMNPIYKIL